MTDKPNLVPESSAVRVALWRALHVRLDSAPHVLHDEIGLKLAAPDEGWQQRPDMHPEGTKFFRASIVARARFVEDLVTDQAARGVSQYVILGAGLDTFAQRQPHIATELRIFEVDQPAPQAWKRQRLQEMGLGIPDHLRFVPVNFESGEDWWQRLAECGFDANKPAVVASNGVSMYLSKDANFATLQRVAKLAPGSTFVMTFIVPLEMVSPEVRFGVERSIEGAKRSGTPFLSFFTPDEMLEMAEKAGIRNVQHVSGTDLNKRYFADRSDGLRLADHAEELLVATT